MTSGFVPPGFPSSAVAPLYGPLIYVKVSSVTTSLMDRPRSQTLLCASDSSSNLPVRPAVASGRASSSRRPSDSEQLRLCWLAREGDMIALERLVLCHQGLVRMLARQIGSRERDRVSTEDLEQEGQVLLLRSIETFDPAQKVPLAAWVATTLRNGMSEYCAAQRQIGGTCVRVPRWVWRQIQAVRALTDDCDSRGVKVTPALVAEHLDVTHSRACELMQMVSTRRIDLITEDGDEVLASHSPDQFAQAVRHERDTVLRQELALLAPDQRAAVLSGVLDAPPPEGMSCAAVIALRRRALANLSRSRQLRALCDVS